MDDSDALLRRTSRAATRLLKSKIREHLYTTKHAEVGPSDTKWGPMLLVEHTFSAPALREWAEVLPLWQATGAPPKEALEKILSEAFVPAASEVLNIFDDEEVWAMRKLIEQYHRDLMGHILSFVTP